MVIARRLMQGVLGFGAAAMLAFGCAARPGGARSPTDEPLTLPRNLRIGTASGVIAVALDDYVLATILAEVSPVGETNTVTDTILEVQAIVARSYAAANVGRHRAQGFDLCDDTHCQRYDPARVRTSRFSSAAKQAVERTTGRVLVFGRHIAEGLFHADCGGATAPAEAVWGRAVPYLPGIADDLPGATHREWRLSLTTADLRRVLNTDDQTRVGARLDAMTIVTRDASGRAATIALAGERPVTVRGDAFRSIVNRGLPAGQSLLSTRFETTVRGDQITFAGTGFGHGVGLCQRGAAARARRGDQAAAILAAYFPGTRVGSAADRSMPRPQPWPGRRP